VTGFVTDFHDLDSKLRSILSCESSKKPAVEVNQWKYRTCTTDESFDCEFFYNGGNLSNADIRRQFLHVISCLELIGRQVWGWSTDGNSNNVKAMKIISEAAGESIPPLAMLDSRSKGVSKSALDKQAEREAQLCQC